MAEAPAALAAADDDLLQGFWVTVMYAMGTVPVQLSIGLMLAYLLFQPIRFRSFFRMVYFIPYITPFVATSIVFRIIFDARENAPANRIIGIVGIEPQRWILERSTIGDLLGLPDFLAGPSLALIVIMIYSTWTYIGYDAVIFLAGLGNISGELYEAATHRRREWLAHLSPYHPALALAHGILPLAGGDHRHFSSLHADLDPSYRRCRQPG